MHYAAAHRPRPGGFAGEDDGNLRRYRPVDVGEQKIYVQDGIAHGLPLDFPGKSQLASRFALYGDFDGCITPGQGQYPD